MNEEELAAQAEAEAAAAAEAEAEAASQAAAVAAQPITRADLEAFGATMSAGFAQALKGVFPGAAPAAGDPPVEDWQASLTKDVTSATLLQVQEMVKPTNAASIAELVAGDFGPAVKKEIVAELMTLPGHVVARITQDPADLKRLARMARGIHAEQNPTKPQAPGSSPAGTVGGATNTENQLAEKFWNDYKDVPGFTKDDAKKMAKERA